MNRTLRAQASEVASCLAEDSPVDVSGVRVLGLKGPKPENPKALNPKPIEGFRVQR